GWMTQRLSELRIVLSDPFHAPSAGLVERHAEDTPAAPAEWGRAVLARLQAVCAADGDHAVARAEQHGIAQPGGELAAAGLWPFGHVTEEELPALEAVRGLVRARAQHHGELEREEHPAAQVPVQGVEPARTIAQQDRRRFGLPRLPAAFAERLPLQATGLLLAQQPPPAS